MDEQRAYPRDAKHLLREVDATIRIKDIREWHRLRDVVAIKWWESSLLALLFISGIGIIVTVAKLIPNDPRILYYFILGWSVLWILTLISCIEFLILKFRALRRMHEITDRVIRRLESDADRVRAALEAAGIEVFPAPQRERKKEAEESDSV